MSSDSAVERVAKAVRKAREMSLCSLCDGPHSHVIRCTCHEIAQAAIDEMNALCLEEHGVPMFVEREPPPVKS
jgi:transcriptional regulator of NAD metabolism